jgi:hypothetical protein
MPNFCENELTITGPDIDKVLATIRHMESDNPDEHILDFDKIIPYPQDFKDLDKRNAEYQQKHRAIVQDDPERDTKLKALAGEYGVEPGMPWLKDGFNSGGFEWCCENWGTKWNACHVSLSKRGEGSAFIEFETAWSPPVPVIEKLATLFPDHDFELEYFEGGMGFCGQARWSQGEEQYHNHSDYYGHRGG